MNMLQRLVHGIQSLQGEKGQGLVEYILITCLVAVVVGFVLVIFGQGLADVFYFVYMQIAETCGCL